MAAVKKTPEEILKEAEEAKKAAAAEVAAQQQSAQTIQPEQPKAPTIESEADIDRRLTEMMMKEAQEDKAREEARIRRQQAARSLSDLGSVFTDLIKASEGAVVSPRQVEQHYQQLDNRQRQLYDTYRARMDAIRQGKLNRDRARAKDAQDADEAEKNRQLRRDLEKAQLEQRERESKRSYNYHYNNNKPKYSLLFGNEPELTYNDATGRRVFGKVFSFLVQRGYINAEMLPKTAKGEVRMPTAEEIHNLVHTYFDDLSVQDMSELYEMLTGKKKDFSYLSTSHQGSVSPQTSQLQFVPRAGQVVQAGSSNNGLRGARNFNGQTQGLSPVSIHIDENFNPVPSYNASAGNGIVVGVGHSRR